MSMLAWIGTGPLGGFRDEQDRQQLAQAIPPNGPAGRTTGAGGGRHITLLVVTRHRILVCTAVPVGLETTWRWPSR